MQSRRRRGIREIVATGLTNANIGRLRRNGYRVTGDRELAGLGLRLTRLRIPRSRSQRSAQRFVRRIAGASTVATNNRYRRPRGQFTAAGAPCGQSCPAHNLTAWTNRIAQCAAGTPVGMIDTGVDINHPALRAARITRLVSARKDRKPASTEHGTAVASVLVGAGPLMRGVIPNSPLISVNAFHRSGKSERADTFDLVAAIGLLADRNVEIVNMSLTGPANAVLKQGVDKAVARGIRIISAVGHPSRYTGYPAKYDGVIAVSSVDGRLRPSRRSKRGSHVDFSAPGTGLIVAGPKGGARQVDGSSFATPFVTAAYAAVGKRTSAPDLYNALSAGARDLGKPGRDPIYGWGLIQYSALANAGCAVQRTQR